MTRNLRLAVMFVCLAVLCPAFLPIAKADGWDKKTVITFSGPVNVANVTLPAGTYVFKLMESPADRHIVQIFDESETHIYATILAIPDSRLEPADTTVVKFAETSSSGEANEGALPSEGVPVKEWFYPGDTYGQEFRIRPVSAVATGVTDETAKTAAQEPAAEAAAAPEAPAKAEPAQPSQPAEPEAKSAEAPSSSVEQAAPSTQAEPSPSTEQATPPTMPKTASTMPLIALVGLFSLGTAAGLRLVRSRVQ